MPADYRSIAPIRWLPALGTLAAVGALLCPAAARAQEELVRLDDRRAISNAGIYIAIEKGYFKEAGIRNELIEFASAAKVIPALTAGEMEVSPGRPAQASSMPSPRARPSASWRTRARLAPAPATPC